LKRAVSSVVAVGPVTLAFVSLISVEFFGAVESDTLGSAVLASPLEQAFITKAEQAAAKRRTDRIDLGIDFIVCVTFLFSLFKVKSAGEIKLKGVMKV
jgi:hypothetical protein